LTSESGGEEEVRRSAMRKIEGTVLEAARALAANLPLFRAGEAPIAIPPNFKAVSREDLLGGPLWKSFVTCFRDVFGRGDIWGEGFICSRCDKVFPIEAPVARCECGGELVCFYPEEDLRRRFEAELEPPAFCTVMLSSRAEVEGFCLGFIGDIDRLCRYVVSDKHVRESETAVRSALNGLGRFLFFDETGILKSSRAGVPPLVYLSRMAFEKGDQEGVSAAVTWTTRKSPVYKICHSFGFVDFLETGNGIIFMLSEDFIPALKVMQNKSSSECAKILVRMLRLCPE
jgi:hypothetical protein